MKNNTQQEKLLKKINALLPCALHMDRHSAAADLVKLKKTRNAEKSGEPALNRLGFMCNKLERSAAIKQKRIGALPKKLSFPDLPITRERKRIVKLISENQVVIVSGETGSGKTTQLPKFCIEAGRGAEGRIACTQPRRIAAITVAARIAEETGQHLGQSVGYKIRFSDEVGEKTVVKMMTDGMLLAETQTDKYLNEYDTIIVDEAHERSLNIDFLLGMLKQLVKKRKDLKLIITSATIDTEKFSKAFFDAPIVGVSGRMYPIDVRYITPESFSESTDDYSYVDGAVGAVEWIENISPFGDILVFMPTEQDIRETCEILAASRKNSTVLPLYARLSAPEQSAVFKPATGRKIIVATNVAETSITIPNIKYVVDTGLARISSYIASTRTTALPVSSISKSSADQRKGRCGRVQNGVCIRLYSEEDYLSRPLYTPPEILRANLAEVILRMVSLNLGEIENFDFVDPPPARQIKEGFNILFELGAVEKTPKKRKKDGHDDIRLTPKGKMMARMPLDPRLSKMLIEAGENGVFGPVCVVAAALTIPDPRVRPEGSENRADQAHARFIDRNSDFITVYNIWRGLLGDPEISRPRIRAKQLKQYTKDNFLSFRRMREWIDVCDQVLLIIKDSGNSLKSARAVLPGFADNSDKQNNKKDKREGFSSLYSAIHRSVLSGFLANIAEKKEKNIYRGARQREIMIFPGSSVFNRGGNWIVAAEIVETTRRFARTVANIDSAWLESLGKTLCKYTYFDPVWQKNKEAVIAKEQVSLYGLIIISGRPVNYGKIDRKCASQIFITHALINGDVKEALPFMKHNRELVREIRDMESRIRRRDLLADEEDMAAFYEKRLDGICDMRALRHMIRKKGSDDFLKMNYSDLMRKTPDDDELSRFPDALVLGDSRFSVTYRFNPGQNDDGATLTLPAAAARDLPQESTDWVVPGLLEEKITALIRNLPKTYRKQLVPVNDTVAIIMEKMPKYTGSLAATLSRFIYERFKVDIPVSKWKDKDLPDHLKLRFSVVDAKGEVVCSTRDKAKLNSVPDEAMESPGLAAARKKWEKDGLVSWDVGDLPETINIDPDTGTFPHAYPALVPKDDRVALRLYTSRTEALAIHRKGVARLFAIYFAKDIKHLKKAITLSDETKKSAMHFGGAPGVKDAITAHVIDRLFTKNISREAEFFKHARNMVNDILPKGKSVADAVCNALFHFGEVQRRIADVDSFAPPRLVSRIRSSLARLVPGNFITLYTKEQIDHLPRYMKALLYRLERGLNEPEKDRIKNEKIKYFYEKLDALLACLDESSSPEKREAVEQYFWMIEEYKVSLFAQELKTAIRVSGKRLEEKYAEIERML